MDTVGNLELSWAQGYDGSHADYITRDVLCFKCGNKVKFVGEDGVESVFPSPTEGLGPLAVNNMAHVFAVAGVGIKPTIYIYQYPSYRMVAELQDGAQLEYTRITFSASVYLASISGVPEFELTIWDYTTGSRLCTAPLAHTIPTALTFNPGNWRQLCISGDNELTVWNIERSDTQYHIEKQRVLIENGHLKRLKVVKLQLPPADGSIEEEERDIPTRASTRMSRVTISIPHNSVAGVCGDEADRFEQYQDTKKRVKPKSHVWTPVGDILVGCEGGQLLKVDGETFHVRVLYQPGPRAASVSSRLDSAISGVIPEDSELEEPSSASLAGHVSLLTEGTVNCLALHKKALFAAGSDGTIRQLDLSGGSVQVAATTAVGARITSLSFNPSHHRLAAGSDLGSMVIYSPEDPAAVKMLFDIHHSSFVGVECIKQGNDLCATVRGDGTLQVWQTNTANLLASFTLGAEACSIASSPLSSVVAVGVATGYVYYMDLTNPSQPRLIHREHLHTGPVNHLVFNQNGLFLLSGSDDGHIFVVDGRPTQNFKPLGFVEMAGMVEGISVHHDAKTKMNKVCATSNVSDSVTNGANRIAYFDIPDNLATDLPLKHATLRCDFKDSILNRLSYNLTSPSLSIALAEGNVAFTLSQKTKHFHKLMLPTEPPKKEFSKDSYLQPIQDVEGHQLATVAAMRLSPHEKWVGSVASDGKLCVRAVGALDRAVDINAHDFGSGGCINFCFSGDGQRILTTGHDGTLACFKWNFTTSGESKGQAAVNAAKQRANMLAKDGEEEDTALMEMPDLKISNAISRPTSGIEKAEREKQEKEARIDAAIEKNEPYKSPTPEPDSDATWIRMQELEALKVENHQYSELKGNLRGEITNMRHTLQSMMKNNETVPDIEKLSPKDFDLDVEEQHRLQLQGDAEVHRIREEKEFENLAKQYLTDLIKKECWDDMKVKGRGILAFNSGLEVHNYPMKSRSREELDALDRARSLRQIELEDLKARREFAEISQKSTTNAVDDDANGDEEDGDGTEKPSVTGSLGAKFGGESDLFYSQFELHTREQKMLQVSLLEDAIYRIKEAFNKEFTEVYSKKDQEIQKIREKNKRIRKILNDLDLPEDMYEPEMGVVEKPEMLLQVSDEESEEEELPSIAPLDKPVVSYTRKFRARTPQAERELITIEKYLTPEQRQKQEHAEAEETERRAREKGDNWRDRGLDWMMGGVLEIKKEDELKKDVPTPAFMAGKPEDDWTDDERKAVMEYERRVKELLEEREKYRKQLEMELKKIQTLIEEGAQQFDEVLRLLFLRKVKTEMVIFQEELKMMRLKQALLVEEELDNREQELSLLLEHNKQLKHLSGIAVVESKKHVEAFKEEYENLMAEDKVMDKAFKREFNDVPAVQVDALYRLFKRRPRGQKVRGVDTPGFDPSSGNPFSERPSTARQNDYTQKALEQSLVELDKLSNSPDGVEPVIWERMCSYRHLKIKSEHLKNDKALVLAEMQAFLQQRQQEDEVLRSTLDGLVDSISILKEERLRFMYNLEVQLLLKQGQVEVDAGNYIHNYRESLLIHRTVVEELNGKIRSLGKIKISSMEESKDFRKGIIQLEWEHKKMTMEMEDLQNKMRDIQSLKVTREIQAYLYEDDHESKKAQEIQTLEQTLVLLKQHHERNVQDKKHTLKDLKKTGRDKVEENEALSHELEELNVSVNERRHVHEVNADKRSDAGQEQRYHEIVQRRKLVDLAKAQAQEVAVLRAEVERLRMRTFPALVQVEH